MTYIERVADSELVTRLAAAGAVVVEGPKASGKTSTAERVAASQVRLDLEPALVEAAEIAPELVLEGDVPRLLDEWQVAPSLWNQVRRAVDDRRAPGQFILTGSVVPTDDIARHTGAGRFSFVRMRPLSTFEAGVDTATVSLEALASGTQVATTTSDIPIEDIAALAIAGGWPANHGHPLEIATRANADYLRQSAEVDVARLTGEVRDPQRMRALIASLARNVGTEARRRVLAEDAGITEVTTDRYLSVLDRLMLTEDQPAWVPSVKSRARLRRSAKRHFVDPALACAALGVREPRALVLQPDFFGQVFESMVVRDLRVLTQPNGGRVHHYRDSNGLEVDAIIDYPQGWAAVEIKLNHRRIDQAAEALRRLTNTVDSTRTPGPLYRAIVTPAGPAYQRPDGIHVLPLAALAP